MRTTILTASLAAALAAAPASADPLGEVLSIARRIGYESGYLAPRRPAGQFYYYNSYGQPYAGPRSAFRYVPGNPGVAAGDELLQMDYELLRSVARASSAELDRWMSSIPAGEVWRKHFELCALQETLASNANGQPTDAERDVLLRILGIFDRAVASADLADITSLPSARRLHAALRELATPSDQRLVRQVSLNARMLNRALGAFNTGVTWQRYLALPDGIVAAADRPPGDAGRSPEFDADEIARIVERYDQVSQSPEYGAIASLPEFQATHQRLSELVNPPPQPPAPPQPPRAVAEELPPPELQTR